MLTEKDLNLGTERFDETFFVSEDRWVLFQKNLQIAEIYELIRLRIAKEGKISPANIMIDALRLSPPATEAESIAFIFAAGMLYEHIGDNPMSQMFANSRAKATIEAIGKDPENITLEDIQKVVDEQFHTKEIQGDGTATLTRRDTGEKTKVPSDDLEHLLATILKSNPSSPFSNN